MAGGHLLVFLLGLAASDAVRPCDIYQHDGTPCVAAHSTVRALFSAYRGSLYVVRRQSDNKTTEIGLNSNGFADSATQDTFCAKTNCTIIRIFDQSPKANHLHLAHGGGAVHTPDVGVNATKDPLHISGNRVYSAYFEGGMGYRNDKTSGVAKGDEPESIYMVTSGKHYNDKCCFDYGNAETNNLDDGRGAMECVYFGNKRGWDGGGGGKGPWVMADLEKGLWAGSGRNPNNTAIEAVFVTAMVKGRAGGFALKGGDAQGGTLRTLYNGPRPRRYNPMKKQGAIILGIGGDNSNWAVGTFFEGAVTSGFSSDAADDAVHANIVAAQYGH